jgi:dipeptidyl aminopeptidase/acylaminoacyl peptidase
MTIGGRVALMMLAVSCAATSTLAAPPIETYGKLPSLEFVRLSPSGDRIAFVAVDGENRRLFVRKVGGDALVASSVGASKVRNIEWAGDDLVLISLSSTLRLGDKRVDNWSYSTRYELFSGFIVNLKTRSITQLFGKDANSTFLVGSLFNAVNVDGHWYDFVDTASIINGSHILRVDLETGKSSIVRDYGFGDYSAHLDDKGVIVARSRYDEYTRKWNLLVGEHGEGIVVARPSPLGTVGVAGTGRTENTILVEEEGTKADTVDEYPIVAGATPTRLFDGLDVEEYLRDPVTHLLIGAILERGRGAVFFDPTLQHRYDAARKAFPGLRVTLESFSTGLGRQVVMTDGGDDPGTFWLVDMSTGHADDLMSAYPGIDAKDVGPTSMFAYHAADGLALEGVLTLPPGSAQKRLPLVVIPHGGPIGFYDDIKFDYWPQAFASRGYAVFQPNYRGSGGYGAPLREAGFGEWGRKMLSDISDGVNALAKADIIDSKRVCIAGASYGGYAALAAVTIQGAPYRCAVSVSGVSDVGSLMVGESSKTVGGRYREALYGATYAADPELQDISPINHADRATAPILLIHGKDDTVVPFVHSLTMNSLLQKAGKPVEFLPLEGEDHWWSREKTRVQILQASVAFVEKYNPAP